MESNIDVVVVNYRTPDLLANFVGSYRLFTPRITASTLTVVDVDPLEADPIDSDIALVVTKENVGYGRACNIGAAGGNSTIIGLFNADTRFNNNTCIDICVQYLLDHDDVAVVGPLQFDSNGMVVNAGILDSGERGFRSNYPAKFKDIKDSVYVSGSAFFIKRSVWDELKSCDKSEGAFLETPLYFEDTWCCEHAHLHGYRTVYLGIAEMVHEWNKSPGGEAAKRSWYKESKALYEKMIQGHG